MTDLLSAGSTSVLDGVLSEATLGSAVDLLVRLVEGAGAVVVFVGAIIGFVRFVIVAVRDREPERFVPVRLDIGRYLLLGLEFQLAGDILRTAVAPTLTQIGELAAIAAIRTALNFFIGREITEEREELRQAAAERRGDVPGPPA